MATPDSSEDNPTQPRPVEVEPTTLDPRGPLDLVHEATITTRDGETVRIVAANRSQIEHIAAEMMLLDEAMASDEPVPSESSTAQSSRELAAAAVDELVALLSGHDAFDVMSMLTRALVPPDLSLWRESETTAERSWASAEVAALVLLGMGLPTRSTQRRTAEIIPEVIARATHLLELSDIDAINTWADAVDSVSDMAWALRSHETRVRGRHYTSIAERINDAIPGRRRATDIWTSELGYSYDEVLRVRAA